MRTRSSNESFAVTTPRKGYPFWQVSFGDTRPLVVLYGLLCTMEDIDEAGDNDIRRCNAMKTALYDIVEFAIISDNAQDLVRSTCKAFSSGPSDLDRSLRWKTILELVQHSRDVSS